MALSYQWYMDDLPVGDGTATYSGTAGAVKATHPVYCEVTNEAGTTTSNVVTLTVVDVPEITQQPTDLTVGVNDPFEFTIVATE